MTPSGPDSDGMTVTPHEDLVAAFQTSVEARKQAQTEAAILLFEDGVDALFRHLRQIARRDPREAARLARGAAVFFKTKADRIRKEHDQ